VWSHRDRRLPAGRRDVTLLLADVEGSTRLWETQSEEIVSPVGVVVGDVECRKSSAGAASRA
jgi:class 3 adenylate cyclase